MEIIPLPLAGAALIKSKKFLDGRGFFSERFRAQAFAEAGLPTDFPQENFSRSAGLVLRGLHYQFAPAQGKLVTCMAGRIWDVITDIRIESPTLGKSFSVELDGDEPQWLWAPAGFAHGFCVLSEQGADMFYKVTSYYNKAGEDGIRWNDEELKVAWPLKNPLLSARDQSAQSFSDYKRKPRF
jgi:dTDP-4-dehydrorhamnose 3,5-epimerase